MKTSILFPGQGSQSIGMLSDAYAEFEVVRNTFAEASEALGFDMWALVSDGPLETLNKTENTQPAILVASVALYRVWQELGGGAPCCVSGHSLGEYTALVAAEALSFTDAVKLVQLRGQLMQQAVPLGEGAMAAIIGLDDEGVVKACETASQGDVVSAVNFNAPGQVVIAGSKTAVDRAIIACKEAGAKRALPLPVSVPAHSALMKQAATRLEEALRSLDFNDAVIPVIQNVTATLETDKSILIDNLVKQLYSPVLWTQSVKCVAEQGAEAVVECGPGKVLSGLVKRIDRNLVGFTIENPEKLREAVQETSK
ncbi:ACP S-malonyltransferase [Alkalimarinus alittae]|nr:ACP S-malonyltransferase [Alkalimarinus alittae]